MKPNAPLYSLGWKDLAKGFLLTVITIILTGLVTILNSNGIPTWETLRPILLVGLSAGISYLLKNFFTDSNDKFLGGADIKLPLIIGFTLLGAFSYAQVADSAAIHDNIVNGVNNTLAAIPAPPPFWDKVKLFAMAVSAAVGGSVTAFCIHKWGKKTK